MTPVAARVAGDRWCADCRAGIVALVLGLAGMARGAHGAPARARRDPPRRRARRAGARRSPAPADAGPAEARRSAATARAPRRADRCDRCRWRWTRRSAARWCWRTGRRRAAPAPSRSMIEGLNIDTGEWEPPAPGQRYSELQAGVQLANRSGALNEIEYSEFVQKCRLSPKRVGALPDFPDMLDVVARARELDGFAGPLDAQLTVRLLARSVAWSVGYVQQCAARHGLVPAAVPGRWCCLRRRRRAAAAGAGLRCAGRAGRRPAGRRAARSHAQPRRAADAGRRTSRFRPGTASPTRWPRTWTPT